MSKWINKPNTIVNANNPKLLTKYFNSCSDVRRLNIKRKEGRKTDFTSAVPESLDEWQFDEQWGRQFQQEHTTSFHGQFSWLPGGVQHQKWDKLKGRKGEEEEEGRELAMFKLSKMANSGFPCSPLTMMLIPKKIEMVIIPNTSISAAAFTIFSGNMERIIAEKKKKKKNCWWTKHTCKTIKKKKWTN